MIGKTLSHYRVIQELGRGGMGEVYIADDISLDRKVALKFLPDAFTGDPERMARFEREAKLLASLNHPNIAAIYGLEQAEGKRFIVLELVEGETLAQRLSKGSLPVEEALAICRQIAEGLEAAHEKGVIHRDLKPANVMITEGDKVKILDFGLAKALSSETPSVDASQSPTITEAMTQPGIVLGTAAYMSPEQAKGKSVDKRADIWGFGCILYECLTGKRVFEGETVTETLAAVLTREPDFSALPPNLHPRIRLLLERCLEKEIKNRYGSISDARVDIQKALADPKGVLVHPVTTVEPRTGLRTMLPWVAAAIVLTAIIAGVAVWHLKPPEPRQVIRFSYELPKDQQFDDLTERAFAVSPDGRQFVYSTSAGLYLRSMDDLDAKFLAGTGGNLQRPFFSPDAKWIGFFSSADKKLKKIAIRGGAPVTLADVEPIGSFSWNADDTIVYGQQGKGIMRVSANGGTPEVIVKEENEAVVHPQILPDGKSLMFTLGPTPLKTIVQSLKSGERKELFAGDTAKYLSTGHIVYSVGNSLLAIPFDLNALKVVGGPVPIVEGVLRGLAPQYAVSDSGTLVYVPGTASAAVGRTLVWVNRDGKEEPLSAEQHNYNGARISPDGTKVALQFTTSGNRDIWIWDLVRKTMSRLTLDPAQDIYPLWTTDGKQIAFASDRDGGFKVYWKAADGTGKDEPLGSVPGAQIIPAAWSRDGKTLVLMEKNKIGSSSGGIGALSMESDHKYRPLLREKYNEVQPRISPDGRWMAYTSDESGQAQIYVRPFPDVDKGRWQVSTSGGDSPLWSRDGRELFYHNGNAVMAVPVKTEPTFSLQTPKTLFQGTYLFPTNSLNVGAVIVDFYPWDISPDGKRFLMIKPPGTTTSAEGGPRKINIVLNWFEELKQRVPTGK